MDRTEAPIDDIKQEQDQVLIEKSFQEAYRPREDVYEQVIKGNQATAIDANMRRPSTFALKMKKEIAGVDNKELALQDDMWDYEDEDVEIDGQPGQVTLL